MTIRRRGRLILPPMGGSAAYFTGLWGGNPQPYSASALLTARGEPSTMNSNGLATSSARLREPLLGEVHQCWKVDAHRTRVGADGPVTAGAENRRPIRGERDPRQASRVPTDVEELMPGGRAP